MTTTSVIIPAYNRAALIGATLDSVLAQNHPVSEVLVVDDGSTDNTREVVREYETRSQGIIRLIEQKNAGPSVARNHGLSLCKGDYVAFLDADDLWLPTKIQKQLALLQSDPTAVACYTRMFQFQKNLDDLGRPQTQNVIDEPDFAHVFLTMCIQSSMPMIRGPIARSLRFEENIRAAEDAIYFAQVAQHGRWRLLDEPLVAYRVHGVQLTADPNHLLQHVTVRGQWLHQHAAQLPAGQAGELEEKLWAKLVQNLESRYWRREVDGLRRLVEQMREHRPQALTHSFLNTARIHPRWVYRLRDLLIKG